MEMTTIAPGSFSGKSPFPQGTTIAMPGALMALEAAGMTASVLFDQRNAGGWREKEEEDKSANRGAGRDGSRLYFTYTLPTGIEIWLITEPDRTVSILLLPEEY